MIWIGDRVRDSSGNKGVVIAFIDRQAYVRFDSHYQWVDVDNLLK